MWWIALVVLSAVIAFAIHRIIPWVRRVRAAWERIVSKAALFDSSWDIQCIASFDGRIRVANAALSRLLGFSVAELESMNTKQFIHPEDAVATCVEFKRILEGQVTLHFESRWRAKDGSFKPLEWNGVPDVKRKLIYFVGRDVGHIKEVFNDLEAKKAAAELATRAKSEFLAIMSHEIRTPLNGVIVTANLLQDTQLTAEQHEYLDIIRTSGSALLSVINDILDFSRIESKKLDLEMCEFDLCQCMEESIDLCSGSAAEKQIDLVHMINNDVPVKLIGDAARLRQVLVNLAGNGVKFTPHGEVVLSVSLADPAMLTDQSAVGTDAPTDRAFPAQSDEVLLHFAVRDTGIGVPEDGKQRLFRSFSQVDSSTTRRYGGSGLGLAICCALVKMMGGRIWMESEGLGKGCTFHFVVRLQRAPAKPVAPQSPHSQSLRGRRILFAEDNRSSRGLLLRHAMALGLQAEIVRSGKEAVQLAMQRTAEGRAFDAIVVDQVMPEVDGEQTAQMLRERGCSEPIVLMAYKRVRDPGTDKSLYAWNADVLKPVKATQLHRVLCEVLHVTEPRSSGSGAATPRHTTSQAKSTLHRLRVLLAEDVVVNQRVAAMQIQKLGFGVPDIVSNGEEALDALARRDYDLVLMDVSMPVLDGIEATRRLRARRPREFGPMVVALTANVFPQQVACCIDCGMDGYISKPVSLQELEAVLRRAEAAVPSFAAACALAGPLRMSPQYMMNKQPRKSSQDAVTIDFDVPSILSTPAPTARHAGSVGTGSIVHAPSAAFAPAAGAAGPADAPMAAGTPVASPGELVRRESFVQQSRHRADSIASQPAGQSRRNSTEPLEDRSTLDLLREEGVLADVVSLYKTQARAALAALRKASLEGDAAQAQKVVHSLRGSSASVGARQLAAMMHDAEAEILECKGLRRALLESLESESERVFRALERECTSAAV